MPVIARDTVASDHLVYAWPFPIGPEEYEVACAEDEQVVMCPAWVVGDRLGPGRHRWRTPDPTRPVSAFFVLTAPVEVSFDMSTSFVIPTTGMPVRLRASGSLQVRCGDPGLLIAQFVGLPFDAVNDGIVRSVTRSIERMLARLLTRRVVMAGTPAAVTDPAMLPNIVEELVAYNPAAGAVFGIELMRMGHLSVYADDGTRPWDQVSPPGVNGEAMRAKSAPDLETLRAPRPQTPPPPEPTSSPALPALPARGNPVSAASGEIVVKGPKPAEPPRAKSPAPDPSKVETPQSTDEITQPGVDIAHTPLPGSLRATALGFDTAEPRSAILGIGTSPIGGAGIGVAAAATGAPGTNATSSAKSPVASGEIPTKMAPGQRVLVPGPNGLMQSATIRQLLQGYYELEVGSSGETIWVPMNGVVPE